MHFFSDSIAALARGNGTSNETPVEAAETPVEAAEAEVAGGQALPPSEEVDAPSQLAAATSAGAMPSGSEGARETQPLPESPTGTMSTLSGGSIGTLGSLPLPKTPLEEEVEAQEKMQEEKHQEEKWLWVLQAPRQQEEHQQTIQTPR